MDFKVNFELDLNGIIFFGGYFWFVEFSISQVFENGDVDCKNNICSVYKYISVLKSFI